MSVPASKDIDGQKKILAGSGNGAGTAVADGAESTRDRIVRTAAELFAVNGYDATGIAEIQAKAEISRGAFYYHIDSKQTLLFEISKNQVDKMNAAAAELTARPAPADVKIREMARKLLRNISDHRAELGGLLPRFRRPYRAATRGDPHRARPLRALLDRALPGLASARGYSLTSHRCRSKAYSGC